MSQYPYEPQQPEPAFPQQYPQDQVPPGYGGALYQASAQQGYYPPQGGYPQQPVYYAPPPVQVNVTQNAFAQLAVRQRRVNHALHVTLTIFTSGLWLFVYIPLVRKRRRQVVVYR